MYPIVYILTNESKSAIYVGSTSNLNTSLSKHQRGALKDLSANNILNKLVYFELLDEMEIAIAREKQVRNLHHSWKKKLISDFNPYWENFSISIFQ